MSSRDRASDPARSFPNPLLVDGVAAGWFNMLGQLTAGWNSWEGDSKPLSMNPIPAVCPWSLELSGRVHGWTQVDSHCC